MTQSAAPPAVNGIHPRPFTTMEVVKGKRERIEPPAYVDDDAISLSENSRKVLARRYLRKDEEGNFLESPAGMFYRIASHVAAVEAEHAGDVEGTTRCFYDLLTQLRFFPNSPTFTGAGTPLGQLAACFTGPMRVTTEDGPKSIESLEVGDRVLTHQGRYRPVTELHRRSYSGELLRIKIKLIGTTIEVTPEHPILTPQGWVAAGQLKAKDRVAVGVHRGEHPAPTFDLAQSVYAEELELETTPDAVRVRQPSNYQNSGRQSNWINRHFELTPDLARLCGYYVAEGSIDAEEKYIRFTFSQDEIDYHKDVVSLISTIFGSPVTSCDSSFGNWMNLDSYSRAVATWFSQQFGRGSSAKRIPTWLQFARSEIQEQFLVGLMRGDGLFFQKVYPTGERGSLKTFRSLRLTLSNPPLIQQVWQMCLRLGYDAAIRPVDTTYVTENASDTAQIGMPPLQSRELVQKAFSIDLPEPDWRYVRNTVDRQNEDVFFQIESISATRYDGVVYNCEVAEDHSYVTEGIVVHNCFVLPIEDDMGKTADGIFQTLRNAALIQQTGGGNGFSFSRLRPKGDRVQSSGGHATGPVGFLQAYDEAFGIVHQGGVRRGANMGVLRVDHPDIEEFIECKAEEGRVANFNISVAITDTFMQAVKDDGDFDLINPRDGSVWKTVRARTLFDKIIHYAHHNGEPGALFIDAANRTNPVPHLYSLEATNPCGEQWLGPYENCCLGSINLGLHVRTNEQGETVLDWDGLEKTIAESTHFLDNVVSANAYVPAVPELREAALRARRIGLGIMGLGDLMYKLGIRYGSKEGQEFAGVVMEFVRFHSMKTSIELAEERGPFLAFEGSIYDDGTPGGMAWQPPISPFPSSPTWGRPKLDWGEIVSEIRRHGIRNAAQTTVAPTGTIATVSGCEGYGCEPVFALGYIRHFKDGDKDVELIYTSPLFEAALDDSNLSESRKEEIKQHVATYGSCQQIEDLPDSIRHAFVVSGDITTEEHVRMQAAIQSFVDNSISKTVNCPEGATEEDVAQAYMLAWELGCKGLTVYVTGSRQEVVLETKATKAKKDGSEEERAQPAPTNGRGRKEQVHEKAIFTKRPRPGLLAGSTYRKETPLGTAYVTVNSDGEGEPFEVFLNIGKAGTDVSAVSEAIGRLISLVLRMPGSLPPSERLRWVMDEMAGIGGGRALGFGASRVRSLPDGIAQVLAEYMSVLPPSRESIQGEQLALPLADRPIGDLCPDCGEASFLNIEGCRKCYVCSYSEC